MSSVDAWHCSASTAERHHPHGARRTIPPGCKASAAHHRETRVRLTHPIYLASRVTYFIHMLIH